MFVAQVNVTVAIPRLCSPQSEQPLTVLGSRDRTEKDYHSERERTVGNEISVPHPDMAHPLHRPVLRILNCDGMWRLTALLSSLSLSLLHIHTDRQTDGQTDR